MKKEERQLLTGFLILLYFIILIRNAWISDDAYISFRAIENFIAGYGPNFNPNVRVQVYTHPLWFLLLSLLYFVQVKVFDITLASGLPLLSTTVSILLSASAFYIAIKKLIGETLIQKVFFGVATILSKAFIDYSTSGLENPLTFILLVIFLYFLLKNESHLFELSLLTALIAINRQDAILLTAPALMLRFFTDRNRWIKKIAALLWGFLPLLAWEIFSLLYYGFPFPNTAYAKLNTGIPKSLLFSQGADYFINSINIDVITLLIIFGAGLAVFIYKEKGKISVYIGVILYLLYIINIGGDFMSGRFFAAPFFIAAILISQAPLSRQTYNVAIASIIFLSAFYIYSPIKSMDSLKNVDWAIFVDENGIDDEQAVYFSRSGLAQNGIRNAKGGSRYSGRYWQFTGTEEIAIEGAIGLYAYQQGPNIYVLDQFALADPLLARLPVKDKINWRIGHFQREIPDGYLKTLVKDENLIESPSLAEYYEKLQILIKGPLWTSERFAEIWKFNTGQYDYLIEDYLESIAK